MKRLTLLAFTVLFAIGHANAQEVYNSSGKRISTNKKRQQPKGFDPQRLIIGGAPSVSFGGNGFALGIAPIVGYRFTDKISAGLGGSYYYVKQNDAYVLGTNTYDFKASIFSASVWGRYLFTQNFFGHLEYEHNFTNYTDVRNDPNGSGNVESYWIKYNSPSVLVGAGYRAPITERASIVALAFYDLVQDKYSPYYGRIGFRIGFNVGF